MEKGSLRERSLEVLCRTQATFIQEAVLQKRRGGLFGSVRAWSFAVSLAENKAISNRGRTQPKKSRLLVDWIKEAGRERRGSKEKRKDWGGKC